MYSVKKISFALFLFILLPFFLTNCTTNTYGDRDASRHAAGAAIGGAAAGVGTAALGAPRPMIVGATVGGMALGYYVTTLRFDAGPIYKVGGQVYAQGDYVGINIPAYKLFEANTAEFRADADPILDSIVAVLKRYPNSNILISGNTNGMGGSHRFEHKLSEARARAVASYLWAHGIGIFRPQSLEKRRLAFVGYGNYFPIASDTKIENVQKNSRIQITAYPSKADLKLDQASMDFNNIGSTLDDT